MICLNKALDIFRYVNIKGTPIRINHIKNPRIKGKKIPKTNKDAVDPIDTLITLSLLVFLSRKILAVSPNRL